MPVQEGLQLAGEDEAEVSRGRHVLDGWEEGVEEGVQVREVAFLCVDQLLQHLFSPVCG